MLWEIRGRDCPVSTRERAEWVRKWADWLLVEKTSLRTLGRRMEDAGVLSPRGSTKWSPATIRRILSNRGLLGEFYAYRSGDEPVLVHSDEKLAILSVEEFQVVQNILSVGRIHEVCARLGGVLQNIGCDEWKGLLREFNFRGILQKDPPHVMSLALTVESSPSFVLQLGKDACL